MAKYEYRCFEGYAASEPPHPMVQSENSSKHYPAIILGEKRALMAFLGVKTRISQIVMP
jgi:hypothetical protein